MKAAAVDAFAFRGAERHAADVLRTADDAVFDRLAKSGLIDDIRDETVEAGLTAARERRRAQGIGPYERIAARLRDGPTGKDTEAEVTRAIAEVEIQEPNGSVVDLIHQLRQRFPHAVANGMLQRVREGCGLPYHAIELMAGTGFGFEDADLLKIALSEDPYDHRADAAASVLGPRAVGRLIDRMLELSQQVLESHGRDEETRERHRAIEQRIEFGQTAHVLAAIKSRSDHANSRQISDFAAVIRRQRDGAHRQGLPFDDAAQAEIAGFVHDWSNRLLETLETTREQLASVAALARHVPSPELLPVLERLLDEELRRLQALGEQARAVGYRHHPATNEWRMRWTNWYQGAFATIRCPQTVGLMEKYLLDDEFGPAAAIVLAEQWRAVQEPRNGKRWSTGPDYSRVAQKRDEREAHPGASSPEADIIFGAVERLIGTGATDEAKKHAVKLATIAAALPHGERGNILSTLIDMAEVAPRRALLTNLALAGETIDVELVKAGIADAFEAARTQPWIVTDHGELRMWLSLLPFTNQPSETIEIVQRLPENHRGPDALEPMLAALTHAPGDETEAVLFRIAEFDPRLYAEQAWRDAVCDRGTQSAASHIVELIARGRLDGRERRAGQTMRTRVARLMDEHTEVRRHVYRILENAPLGPGVRVLAEAVAENPDADGLILLVQLEEKHTRPFASVRAVELVVTEHIASEGWEGTYGVVPVAAEELRRKLLDMTTDGGPDDVASPSLNFHAEAFA